MEDRAESFYVDGVELGLNYEPYFEYHKKTQRIVTQYIINHPSEFIGLKRGDIIDTVEEKSRYRNDGKMIWTGEKAIFLEYQEKIDENGYIPQSFVVTPFEFNPMYWSETIDHNYIYWPCLEYREHVRDSLILDDQFTEEKMWHGHFFHHGVRFDIILEDDYIENETYDPKLPKGISVSGKDICITSNPQALLGRKPREYFEKCVMDTSLNFSFFASHKIQLKEKFENDDTISIVMINTWPTYDEEYDDQESEDDGTDIPEKTNESPVNNGTSSVELVSRFTTSRPTVQPTSSLTVNPIINERNSSDILRPNVPHSKIVVSLRDLRRVEN